MRQSQFWDFSRPPHLTGWIEVPLFAVAHVALFVRQDISILRRACLLAVALILTVVK